MEENKTFKGIIHTDYLDRPAVNTILWNEPDRYIKCPHCGEKAKLMPEVYTSNPPQYKYECEHCGKSGFIFCHEARVIYDESAWKPWTHGESKPEPNLYSTKCIICGEEHNISIFHEGPYVCDKCKKAVMAVRKMLEGKDD